MMTCGVVSVTPERRSEHGAGAVYGAQPGRIAGRGRRPADELLGMLRRKDVIACYNQRLQFFAASRSRTRGVSASLFLQPLKQGQYAAAARRRREFRRPLLARLAETDLAGVIAQFVDAWHDVSAAGALGDFRDRPFSAFESGRFRWSLGP